MLEEVEVPVALELRVMHRMFPGRQRVREAAAAAEIHRDCQGMRSRIETRLTHIPGTSDPEGRLEQLLRLHPLRPPSQEFLHGTILTYPLEI
ncbi:MAG: hypothetical protein R3F46_04095 [bacterium]